MNSSENVQNHKKCDCEIKNKFQTFTKKNVMKFES